MIHEFKPVYFPLHPITRDKNGKAICSCREREDCQNVGKHPSVKWSETLPNEFIPTKDCGYGLATGDRSGVWVLDVDPDHEDARKWWDEHGDEFLEHYQVKTPRGGVHVYFAWDDEKPEIGSIAAGICLGLDTRGTGGYVVTPGSPHKNGKFYEKWDNGVTTPKPAPDWLYHIPAIQRKKNTSVPIKLADRPLSEATIKWLQNQSPAVSKQDGHKRLFNVISDLIHSHHLSDEDVLFAFSEHYNPRCMPPWDLNNPVEYKEVLHKIEEARTKRRNATGPTVEMYELLDERIKKHNQVHNEADQVAIEVRKDPTIEWHYPDDLLQIPKRTETFESVSEVMNDLSTGIWEGVIRFDVIRQRFFAYRPPIRLPMMEAGNSFESDLVRIQVWFECKKGIKVPFEILKRVVTIIGEDNPFNPVKNYLDGLPKQSTTNHLAVITHTLYGCLNVTLNRIFMKFLVGVARRAKWPGSREAWMDFMIVLKGPQGVAKSGHFVELFGVVGDDLIKSGVLNFRNKDDCIRKVRDCWIFDVSEMTTFLRGEGAMAKEFITQRHDALTQKYEERTTYHHRICSLVGTTNEEIFLDHDSSGYRRYVVIPVTQQIPYWWIKEHRDEIWTEVNELAEDVGFSHHITNEEAALINSMSSDYAAGEELQSAICDYLKGRKFVRIRSVLLALDKAGLVRTGIKTSTNQISSILKSLGCIRKDGLIRNGFKAKWWEVPPEYFVMDPDPAMKGVEHGFDPVKEELDNEESKKIYAELNDSISINKINKKIN